jgi:site-specific DNA recombinase
MTAARSPKVSATTVVLYARVSSKDQEREGFSIPAQQHALREYAQVHGLTIAQEFVDVETAKQAGRRGFGEMLAFLRATPVCRTILVEKTDRLYRNIRDWVTIDELGIEVHFVKEGIILSDGSRSSEKFMHGIKVLMAKNYIDNLGEEVRKGMLEKARQGHWPSFAPIGYINSPLTRRIEPDLQRAPLIVKVFESYASGDASLKMVTAGAAAAGLTNRSSGRPLTNSKIHQILKNPIYAGDFRWLGHLYEGRHQALISRDLYQRVQDVFALANHPRHTKRQHAFAGLLTCARCGCAITAEVKKGRYTYYHCTGFRGACGNTYIREDELGRLFGGVVKRVNVPAHVAEDLAAGLRQSEAADEAFVRTGAERLRAQQQSLQTKLDRAYDDRLERHISDDLWSRKSAELEDQLQRVRADLARSERPTARYAVTGLQILELAQRAHGLYVTQNPSEQARLVKTLLSNCAFDRGSLTPTYNKPFDLFVNGAETGNWLLR